MSEFPTSGRSGYPEPGSEHGTMDRAKQVASDTAHIAAEQARDVGGEIRTQTGQAVGRLRGRVRDQADAQGRRAAQHLRTWADDLTGMTDGGKPDSPVQGVLHQVAGTGHKAADYLEDRGLSGAVGDVQDFARRRPGVFLAGALAAGFVFARLAKAGAKVAQEEDERNARPSATVQPPPSRVYDDGPTLPATPYEPAPIPSATEVPPGDPYAGERRPDGGLR